MMMNKINEGFQDFYLTNDPLVEYNTWGDTYWGVSGGKCSNYLGKILEEIREKLNKSN